MHALVVLYCEYGICEVWMYCMRVLHVCMHACMRVRVYALMHACTSSPSFSSARHTRTLPCPHTYPTWTRLTSASSPSFSSARRAALFPSRTPDDDATREQERQTARGPRGRRPTRCAPVCMHACMYAWSSTRTTRKAADTGTGAGYTARGTGHRSQGAWYRVQGAGHVTQGTGYRAQGARLDAVEEAASRVLPVRCTLRPLSLVALQPGPRHSLSSGSMQRALHPVPCARSLSSASEHAVDGIARCGFL